MKSLYSVRYVDRDCTFHVGDQKLLSTFEARMTHTLTYSISWASYSVQSLGLKQWSSNFAASLVSEVIAKVKKMSWIWR